MQARKERRLRRTRHVRLPSMGGAARRVGERGAQRVGERAVRLAGAVHERVLLHLEAGRQLRLVERGKGVVCMCLGDRVQRHVGQAHLQGECSEADPGGAELGEVRRRRRRRRRRRPRHALEAREPLAKRRRERRAGGARLFDGLCRLPDRRLACLARWRGTQGGGLVARRTPLHRVRQRVGEQRDERVEQVAERLEPRHVAWRMRQGDAPSELGAVLFVCLPGAERHVLGMHRVEHGVEHCRVEQLGGARAVRRKRALLVPEGAHRTQAERRRKLRRPLRRPGKRLCAERERDGERTVLAREAEQRRVPGRAARRGDQLEEDQGEHAVDGGRRGTRRGRPRGVIGGFPRACHRVGPGACRGPVTVVASLRVLGAAVAAPLRGAGDLVRQGARHVHQLALLLFPAREREGGEQLDAHGHMANAQHTAWRRVELPLQLGKRRRGLGVRRREQARPEGVERCAVHRGPVERRHGAAERGAERLVCAGRQRVDEALHVAEEHVQQRHVCLGGLQRRLDKVRRREEGEQRGGRRGGRLGGGLGALLSRLGSGHEQRIERLHGGREPAVVPVVRSDPGGALQQRGALLRLVVRRRLAGDGAERLETQRGTHRELGERSCGAR